MRLYHFLPVQFALDNLKHRRLKIAQFSDLNDPFELIAAGFADTQQRKILKGWKAALERKWGILCFSRTWQNPVLWSHYGEKHKGVCLGFDIDDRYLMYVNYTRKRLAVDVVALRNEGKLDANLMNRFLRTKFADWSYEKEVRIGVGLNQKDSESGLYFYSFSKELKLAKVIAGPMFQSSKEDLINVASSVSSDIKVIGSRLAFKEFKVVRDKRGFT